MGASRVPAHGTPGRLEGSFDRRWPPLAAAGIAPPTSLLTAAPDRRTPMYPLRQVDVGDGMPISAVNSRPFSAHQYEPDINVLVGPQRGSKIGREKQRGGVVGGPQYIVYTLLYTGVVGGQRRPCSRCGCRLPVTRLPAPRLPAPRLPSTRMSARAGGNYVGD